MEISEINPGQGDVNIEAEVVSIEEPRSFNKFGKNLRVANAKIKDKSGEISLTLWNDDINRIKPGNKIKITKGYAKEFNGEKQLTIGKFGIMEIVGEDGKNSSDEEYQEEAPEVREGKEVEEEETTEEEIPEEDLM